MPPLSELSRPSPRSEKSRLHRGLHGTPYSSDNVVAARDVADSPSPVTRFSQQLSPEQDRLQAVVQEIEQLESELDPLREQYQEEFEGGKQWQSHRDINERLLEIQQLLLETPRRSSRAKALRAEAEELEKQQRVDTRFRQSTGSREPSPLVREREIPKQEQSSTSPNRSKAFVEQRKTVNSQRRTAGSGGRFAFEVSPAYDQAASVKDLRGPSDQSNTWMSQAKSDLRQASLGRRLQEATKDRPQLQ